jgi:hypothetical protein
MDAFDKEGFKLISKLDSLTFIIRSTHFPTPVQISKFQLEGIGMLEPKHKISPALMRFNREAKDRLKIIIRLYRGFKVQDVIKVLPKDFIYDASSDFNRLNLITGTIPSSKLLAIAAIESVAFVDIVPPPPVLLNQNARALTVLSLQRATNMAGGYGLTGKGVVVGVGDAGSPVMHPDLYDRSIDFASGSQ